MSTWWRVMRWSRRSNGPVKAGVSTTYAVISITLKQALGGDGDALLDARIGAVGGAELGVGHQLDRLVGVGRQPGADITAHEDDLDAGGRVEGATGRRRRGRPDDAGRGMGHRQLRRARGRLRRRLRLLLP